MRQFCLFLLLILAGCSSGTVVFAPTAPPPDLSPLRYEHPSGAFSLIVPRTWPVHNRNTTTLASASFSAPGGEPLLTAAVINTGAELDLQAFSALLDQYQTNIRPDITLYTEQERQAMGDGSWRITGLRRTAGDLTEQVNTFFEQSGGFIGVLDVVLPADSAQAAELQGIINTFAINPAAELAPAELSVLVAVVESQLDIVHVSQWATPAGVFYITGEIANYGTAPVTDLPVEIVLYTEDGLPVASALDTPMGYAVLPGEFMPFSLRFGQGQPAISTRFEMTLGSAEWQNNPDISILGGDVLNWTDESTYNEREELVVTGTVTNNSSRIARSPRVIVTLFGDRGAVIGARFVDLGDITPGGTLPYEIIIAELGGEPLQYIVTVQALP